VLAVAEGRRIYSNIRTFLRYGLSGGFAEVLVLLVGPFLGLAAPLAAGQILWINMLTHGLPGVAFGGEPLDPAVMGRPSPSPQRSTLGGGLWWQVLATGAGIGAASLAAGLWARQTGEQVQACVFLTLGLAQLGVALALRAPRHGLDLAARGLELAVLVSAVLQVLPVLWAPAGELLRLRPVGPAAFVTAVVLGALPGAVLAVLRLVSRSTRRRGAIDRVYR
jgi:P-type Ca2+ transporter type 2C